MYKDGACGTGRFDRRLRFMNEAPTDYRRHRAAFEVAPIERRIARFASGLGSSKSPGAVQRKNREIGGLAGRDCALLAKYARGTGRKQLDHAHQRHTASVHQLLQRKTQRRLESGDSKERAVKFNVL